MREVDISRFWSKVDRRGGDECWEWTGPYLKRGYGAITIEHGQRKAHRLSYELANGPIPAGLFVCHSCDNPPCVNPAHLFLGTPADNMRDMYAKGRGARGEGHGRSPLTAVSVMDIRARATSGEAKTVLASEFGVSATAIRKIVSRKSWGHVA